MLLFSERLVLIFSMLLSECDSAPSGAVRSTRCSPKVLNCPSAWLSSEFSSVIWLTFSRGLLKVLHCVSGFDGDRLDNFKHFGGRFAEIGRAFSGEHFPISCPARSFRPLRNVDRHVAEQPELHQARFGVAINHRVSVHLNIYSRFELGFAVSRSRGRVGFGRMDRRGSLLCALCPPRAKPARIVFAPAQSCGRPA